MKKFRLNSAILLAAAAILLVMSTVGSTQAALTYYSDNFSAEVTVSNIGVTLLENGKEISRRNYIGESTDKLWDETTGSLLSSMIDTKNGEKLVLGQSYDEMLTVKNSGAIDSYVRVVLTKSWQSDVDTTDKVKYEKNTLLSPEHIELHLKENSGWVIDSKASTKERIVLYHTEILKVGAETDACIDTLRISPKILNDIKVTTPETGKVNYEYEYDGHIFVLEAEVDAVQTHNAKDAIKSAWGVDVTVAADGSISLN